MLKTTLVVLIASLTLTAACGPSEGEVQAMLDAQREEIYQDFRSMMMAESKAIYEDTAVMFEAMENTDQHKRELSLVALSWMENLQSSHSYFTERLEASTESHLAQLDARHEAHSGDLNRRTNRHIWRIEAAGEAAMPPEGGVCELVLSLLVTYFGLGGVLGIVPPEDFC